MTSFVLAACLASVAIAQDDHCKQDQVVAVNVRMIRALQRDHQQAQEPANQAAALRIDGRLQDVSAKLAGLPFRSFHLVFSERRLLGMKKKEVFNLAGGQTLSLRSICADTSKIGLWLRWVDGQGEDVLDTRLHFEPGQSMIAGTEHTDESGLVLVLDAEVAEKLSAASSSSRASASINN